MLLNTITGKYGSILSERPIKTSLIWSINNLYLLLFFVILRYSSHLCNGVCLNDIVILNDLQCSIKYGRSLREIYFVVKSGYAICYQCKYATVYFIIFTVFTNSDNPLSATGGRRVHESCYSRTPRNSRFSIDEIRNRPCSSRSS